MSSPELPKKVRVPELEQAAEGLEGCVQALANGFPDLRAVDGAKLEVGRALRVQLGPGVAFRHTRQDDLLLSFVRLARVATANKAALELISAGYMKEVQVPWRMIDDDCGDIVAMIGPLASADQTQIISGTVEKKFDDPDDLTSSSTRAPVPHLGSFPASIRSPSGTFAPTGELAYARAVLGGPSLAECVQRQASRLYRSLLVAELVARGAHRIDVVERAVGMAADLARTTGCDTPPTGRSGEDQH